MKKVLLTSAAGFIVARTGELLLKQDFRVVGLDNTNDYYDVRPNVFSESESCCSYNYAT